MNTITNDRIQALTKQMTLEEKAGLCSGLDFSRTKAVERLGIPQVRMCDGPHGLRKQEEGGDHLGIGESIRAVCFPTASALAASFDTDLVRRVGETLGSECEAENVAMLLGPGANIKRSPLCGRNFEYFSEDPCLSGTMAAAHIQGLQSRNTGACLKHFAANNQETRRMSSDSVVDERTLREIYLASFEGAVKGGKPKSVMCSYNKVNGVFLAENKRLLTEVLRGEWGFGGFVVTDWLAVKDRVTGLTAGLDFEMPGPGEANTAKIVAAVKSGALDEAVLDTAVTRFLSFVFGYTENHDTSAVFDREKGHRIAVETAAECAVLLKNDGGILPLKRWANIAVIGEFAKKPRYQGGGSSHINAFKVDNAFDVLGGVYAQGYTAKSDTVDEALIAEAVQAAENAETAVIFAGLPDSYESEGFDRKHINLPENQNALIRAVCKVQKNVIVVLHNGVPVAMPWIGDVKAVLEMYLSGEGGGTAAASLLLGEVNPSGKLAETFPLKLSDTPSYLNFPGYRDETVYREGVYVGYRYYDKKEMPVLFPFGHGLSYTSFEYSELKLDKADMKDTETCTVTAKIKNTGNAMGKEVVQLYVRNHEDRAGDPGIDRPIRELKGFAKIALEPGEEKTVSFTLDKRSFAYYDVTARDWAVESGEFTVELGASSRDIRLSAGIAVEGTTKVPLTFTRYSTIGDNMATETGKAMFGRMSAGLQDRNQGSTASLGDSDGGMVEAMKREMPLAMIVRFAGISEEQLEGMLAGLNS
jgi:beta-glucosidase